MVDAGERSWWATSRRRLLLLFRLTLPWMQGLVFVLKQPQSQGDLLTRFTQPPHLGVSPAQHRLA